jgi:sugar/nucleoside kinase (ribokinase family)
VKHFEYGSYPVHPLVRYLDRTPLIRAKSFHFFALPSELRKYLIDIQNARETRRIKTPRPLIVWEPSPEACYPGFLQSYLELMPSVDVFSPSHMELAKLTGNEVHDGRVNREAVEKQAKRFVDAGIGNSGPEGRGVVVIRCGAGGCFFLKQSGDSGWLRS